MTPGETRRALAAGIASACLVLGGDPRSGRIEAQAGLILQLVEDGKPQIDITIPSFGYNRTSRSTAGTGFPGTGRPKSGDSRGRFW